MNARHIIALVILLPLLAGGVGFATTSHWRTSPNNGRDYYIDKYYDKSYDSEHGRVNNVCYIAYDQSAGTPHPLSLSCVKL